MHNLEFALEAFRNQRFGDAETSLRDWLKRFPQDPRALLLFSRVLCGLSRFEEAEPVLVELTGLESANPEYRFYLGVLYLHLGKLQKARAELLLANALAPGNPICLLNLGLAAYQLNSSREAAAIFGEARRLAPKLVLAAIYEARSLIQLSEMESAKACLPAAEAALGLPADQATEYALAAISLGMLTQAELVLKDALRREPDSVLLAVNLAHVLERFNRVDEAGRLLEGVAEPGPVGRLLHARIQLRQGRSAEAMETIEQLRGEIRVGPDVNEDLRAQLEFDRGRLLDKAGESQAAFDAYTDGNEIDRRAFIKMRPDLSVAGGLAGLMSQEDLARSQSSRRSREPIADAPIFLVGFPRSGTTLLDQILDAHPDIQVLEEKPMVEVVARTLGISGNGTPELLDRIDNSIAERARAAYWAEAGRHVLRDPGQRFVDKNPFNLCRLPLIDRLFPDAQYIFAIRHPLDCILSCFTNRFRYTQYSHGFWRLDEIARIYRDSVSFWLDSRRMIPVRCFDLQYEEFVEGLEDFTRRILAFVGLPWDARVLDYREHALTRLIATPSYDQVVQPVYRTSVERWKRFADRLEEAIQIVGPVAARLGYSC